MLSNVFHQKSIDEIIHFELFALSGGVSSSYIPPPSGNFQQGGSGGSAGSGGSFGSGLQAPPSSQYGPPQQSSFGKLNVTIDLV